MQRKKLKNKKGFTLVELLIAIVIIGLLAGIIIVKLNGARERARDNSVFTVTETLSKAISACLESDKAITSIAWVWHFNGGVFKVSAGQPICGDSQQNWPALEYGWTFTIALEYTPVGRYYAIRAINDDGTKFIYCNYSPNNWGASGSWVNGNLTHKCERSGF